MPACRVATYLIVVQAHNPWGWKEDVQCDNRESRLMEGKAPTPGRGPGPSKVG